MTDLPPGWERAPVGDVTLPVDKTDPRATPDARFDYIDIGGVDGERGIVAVTQGLLGHEAPSRARQRVRSGDVVLSTVRTYMRKTALVPDQWRNPVASTGFAVLRPAVGIASRYLYHAVRRHEFVAALTALQTGSSYPAVRDGDVRAMVIPVAPYREQQRIVAAIEEHLSRLDAADVALSSALRRSSRLRQQLIDTLWSGPWTTVRLREVLGQPLANGRSVRTGDGFPVLRLTALHERKVRLQERKSGAWSRAEAEPFLVRKGDFLVARGNGSLSLVGRGGLIDVDPDPVAYPDTLVRVRIQERAYSPQFLSLVWDSRRVRVQLERAARTTAGIYKINQGHLQEVELPCPPLEEQRRLAAELEDHLAALTRVERASALGRDRSTALRRAVLAAAFGGRLVPQDPADEPASALLQRIRAERAAVTPAKRTRKVKAS